MLAEKPTLLRSPTMLPLALPLLLALAPPGSGECFDLAGHASCDPDRAACLLDLRTGVGVWSEGPDAVAACCAAPGDVCVCARFCGGVGLPCRADERCDEARELCVPLDDPCACAGSADCPAGTACAADGGNPGVCLPGPFACDADAACEGRGFCLGGACQPFPDCWTDHDCPLGSCVDGSCRVDACLADADCGPARWCWDGLCRDRVPCHDGRECAGACTDGHCEPVRCADDASCGAGERCVRGACFPEGVVSTHCATDAPCGDVGLCEAGICQTAWCTSDASCPEGRRCERQLCRPCPGGDCSVIACTSDADCGAGASCADGSCAPTCSGADCYPGYDDEYCGVDEGEDGHGSSGADALGCATARGGAGLGFLAAALALVVLRRR